MNIAIGIDPGIDTGGLAMIPENGEVKVIMTPRISAKGDIDLRAISSFFLDAADKIQEKGGGTLAIASRTSIASTTARLPVTSPSVDAVGNPTLSSR